MSNLECDVCMDIQEVEYMRALYPWGSEGAKLCLNCRITVAELLRRMKSACFRFNLKNHKKSKL